MKNREDGKNAYAHKTRVVLPGFCFSILSALCFTYSISIELGSDFGLQSPSEDDVQLMKLFSMLLSFTGVLLSRLDLRFSTPTRLLNTLAWVGMILNLFVTPYVYILSEWLLIYNKEWLRLNT